MFINLLMLYDDVPPIGNNGVDPSNIGPHSGFSFNSNLLPGSITQPNGPIQLVLDWSSVSGKEVLTLDGHLVRANAFQDGTIIGLYERDCRTVVSKKSKAKKR